MKKSVLLGIVLFTSSSLFADGTNAGNILIQSFSAKSQGMGETATALNVLQGGLTSFQYNPAALAALQNRLGIATYKNGIFSDGLGVFSYGAPFRSKSLGSFAGTFLYYSAGNMEFLTAAGAPATVNAQKDFAFILSYGFNLWPGFSFGVNGKVLNSEVGETYKATATAADFGTLLNITPSTSFGFSLLNIGTGLKYDKSTDNLPLTFRAGISHERSFLKSQKILAALDVIKRREEALRNSLGLEYGYDDKTIVFALRAGYRFNQDTGKFNLGFGIPYKKYKFDYSSQVLGGIGLSHFFTLGYAF